MLKSFKISLFIFFILFMLLSCNTQGDSGDIDLKLTLELDTKEIITDLVTSSFDRYNRFEPQMEQAVKKCESDNSLDYLTSFVDELKLHYSDGDTYKAFNQQLSTRQ